MFARVFALLPLALLASATGTSNTVNQCNTGRQLCCNQGFSTNQAVASLGSLSILDVLLGIAAEAGVTCSGISLQTCAQQPVCCTNVQQNGLINIGCSPIAV